MKPYKHYPDVDTEDVNRFGQQLLPGSLPILIRDEQGRKVERLLRRPANPAAFSLCNESGLVPMGCGHGLRGRRGWPHMARTPLLEPDGAELPPFGGASWLRSNCITMLRTGLGYAAKCPVCLDGKPADVPAMVARMLVARDGTEPPEQDLPTWAR